MKVIRLYLVESGKGKCIACGTTFIAPVAKVGKYQVIPIEGPLIAEALLDSEPDTKYVAEVVEMSTQDYHDLPEFTGY